MVEDGTTGTSDDGGIDADWDFHENVAGDSGSGSNGEGGEHGMIGYGKAESEDALGIGDEEEEGEGDDEGEKYASGREGVYDQKHRANDACKGLEKGRDEELEAEKSRRENKGNMNAWPEDDEDYDDEGENDEDEDYDEEENDGEDEDYDDEGENGGEDEDNDDEGENDGEDETNGDGDDVYDYTKDDLEDDEHQKQQHTHQAKEDKRVSKEGISGTRGNRTESTGEDDDDGGDESEDFKLYTYRPTPGQDIYGRPVDKGNVGAAPAKYVPPHLRASTGGSVAADSDKRQQVQVREDCICLRVSGTLMRMVSCLTSCDFNNERLF